MTKPDLTILSTHFGTNYSGGSTATCEVFRRLQQEFSSVTVIGTEIGEHGFDDLAFMPYTSFSQALGLLRGQANGLQAGQRLFYGDFYNAVLLSFIRQPFYFTYHDNWPELGKLSWRLKLQSLHYWSCYKRVFRTAAHVFAVSDLKARQVKEFTDHVSLVRNGIAQLPEPQSLRQGEPAAQRNNVLMVGNIDERKYSKAIELFRQLPNSPGFEVDIYGHDKDARLTRALCVFPFVTYRGYHARIPYERYRLLLHTSLMENLSMVWCEAIAHGTPVLSFDVGAAREVICEGNGVLIEPYKTEPMRRQLTRLTNSTEASTATALDADFSWDKAASAYAATLLGS